MTINLSGDQLTRILLITIPLLIGIIGDGRKTRGEIREFTTRLAGLEKSFQEHLTDLKAHRRGWRPKR